MPLSSPEIVLGAEPEVSLASVDAASTPGVESTLEGPGIPAASIMLLLIIPKREPHSSDVSIQEIRSSNMSGETGRAESIPSTILAIEDGSFPELTVAVTVASAILGSFTSTEEGMILEDDVSLEGVSGCGNSVCTCAV